MSENLTLFQVSKNWMYKKINKLRFGRCIALMWAGGTDNDKHETNLQTLSAPPTPLSST
jgi:hypothetical protein